MADRIISLQCPSCGDARNRPVRDHSYGTEFKCASCAATSVLIMDNKLHVKQHGEHVCKDCGRVATTGARFCQCGESLVRKCEHCQHEFFVDDRVCPQCGWNHSDELADLGVMRSLSHKLKESLAAGNWDKATNALRSLLASITSSQQMLPEADAVLRDVLVMSWEKRIPYGNEEFESFVDTMLNKVGQIGQLADWSKNVRILGQQKYGLESKIRGLSEKPQKKDDDNNEHSCLSLVIGILVWILGGIYSWKNLHGWEVAVGCWLWMFGGMAATWIIDKIVLPSWGESRRMGLKAKYEAELKRLDIKLKIINAERPS